jgi:cytochrome c oxidase assembly factor CtaG
MADDQGTTIDHWLGWCFRTGIVLACALAILALPTLAYAHPSQPLAPHELWSAWNPDPTILLGLALSLWGYARGLRRLWRRAGPGRGIRAWQAACFVGGVAALLVALVSPIDQMGAVLFSAHMVQHLVLILVAAPLLVLGRPLIVFLWALPPRWRHRLGRWWRRKSGPRVAWRLANRLATAWVLSVAALWVWHAPALYQAALHDELLHAIEHGSFLGTALLFWWTVIHPPSGRRGYGASVLAIFTMAVQNGLLGALLTFAPTLWYPAYGSRGAVWGLAPLDDQQLAGLIMWIPASLVYLAALALLFVQWLAAVEQSVRRREQRAESVTPSSTRVLVATNERRCRERYDIPNQFSQSLIVCRASGLPARALQLRWQH